MISKKFGSFLIIMIFTIIMLPLLHTAFSQIPSNSENLSVKGVITEGKSQGITVWTIIHENNGTMIIQSPSGYNTVYFSISSSTECVENMEVCFFSSVTNSTNNDIFKVGDTAIFAIDLKSKQQIISLLTGSSAGSDVKISISKIWGNATNLPTIVRTSITHPATNASISIPTMNAGVQNYSTSFSDMRTEYKKLEISLDTLHTDYQKLETSLDTLNTDYQKLDTSINNLHEEHKKSDSMAQNYGITALVNAVGIIIAIAVIQNMQSNKIEKITKQIREMTERHDKIVKDVKEVYASAYVSWVHQITFNYEQVTRILYNDGYVNKPVSENREKIRRALMDHYDHDLFITCPKIEMMELVKVFGQETSNKILSSTSHLRAGDWQPYEDNGMASMIEHYKTYVKKAIDLKDVLLQFCDKNLVTEDLKHRETYQYIKATV